MNTIEELIQKECPEGVEFKKLGEVCTLITGGDTPADCIKGLKEPTEDYPYPIYSNGTEIYGYGKSYRIDKPSVTVSSIGNVGSVFFREAYFTPIIRLKTFIPKTDSIDVKYLYYALSVVSFIGTNSSLSSMKAADFKNLEIPVPPLSVQHKIVEILDKFTSLEAELEAELEARKKQYEYYRNQLFDFTGREDVEWKTIGDLFVFKNGLNKEKGAFGKGFPIVNFTDVFNNRSLRKETLKGLVEVNEKEIENYKVKRGDVFFTRTSETQPEIGMASVMLDDIENCVFSGFVLRATPITDLLLPEYCAYCFSSKTIRNYIIRYSSLTTRALTSGPRLSKIPIAIPSKEEQHRIVTILDKFEALINGQTASLSAEIKARHQQYEYYRDRLLTFSRKEN